MKFKKSIARGLVAEAGSGETGLGAAFAFALLVVTTVVVLTVAFVTTVTGAGFGGVVLTLAAASILSNSLSSLNISAIPELTSERPMLGLLRLTVWPFFLAVLPRALLLPANVHGMMVIILSDR